MPSFTVSRRRIIILLLAVAAAHALAAKGAATDDDDLGAQRADSFAHIQRKRPVSLAISIPAPEMEEEHAFHNLPTDTFALDYAIGKGSKNTPQENKTSTKVTFADTSNISDGSTESLQFKFSHSTKKGSVRNAHSRDACEDTRSPTIQATHESDKVEGQANAVVGVDKEIDLLVDKTLSPLLRNTDSLSSVSDLDVIGDYSGNGSSIEVLANNSALYESDEDSFMGEIDDLSTISLHEDSRSLSEEDFDDLLEVPGSPIFDPNYYYASNKYGRPQVTSTTGRSSSSIGYYSGTTSVTPSFSTDTSRPNSTTSSVPQKEAKKGGPDSPLPSAVPGQRGRSSPSFFRSIVNTLRGKAKRSE